MAEQFWKDLPKHLNTLGEKTIALGHNLNDRFWTMKAEVDRRVAEIQSKNSKQETTQTTSI